MLVLHFSCSSSFNVCMNWSPSLPSQLIIIGTILFWLTAFSLENILYLYLKSFIVLGICLWFSNQMCFFAGAFVPGITFMGLTALLDCLLLWAPLLLPWLLVWLYASFIVQLLFLLWFSYIWDCTVWVCLIFVLVSLLCVALLETSCFIFLVCLTWYLLLFTAWFASWETSCFLLLSLPYVRLLPILLTPCNVTFNEDSTIGSF